MVTSVVVMMVSVGVRVMVSVGGHVAVMMVVVMVMGSCHVYH
jgi:hypothetical protein